MVNELSPKGIWWRVKGNSSKSADNEFEKTKDKIEESQHKTDTEVLKSLLSWFNSRHSAVIISLLMSYFTFFATAKLELH